MEAGYDCASLAEINLALQSTKNNATRCIYANPQKAETDLDAALAVGVRCVTFDGKEELHKVLEAHQKRLGTNTNGTAGPAKSCSQKGNSSNDSNSSVEESDNTLPPEVVLRLLVPDGQSTVPLGEKFGAPPARVEELAREAVRLGLPVVGVSFHCGSGCHDPSAFVNAVRIARNAMAEIDRVQEESGSTVRCSVLDLGGGYPGFDGAGGDEGRFSCAAVSVDKANVFSADDGTDKETKTDNAGTNKDETAAKIATEVVPLLDELVPTNCGVEIISEPGRYFVEAAFALCSRIYSKRVEVSRGGGSDATPHTTRHYYISQGVQGVFKDVVLCNETFVPVPLRMTTTTTTTTTTTENGESPESLVDSVVHGPSGEDYDVVCRMKLPVLEVGDWLIWDRMGAYTLSIAARSGLLPIRYVVGGQSST